MKIYLVGGAVRDKLLGLPIKERDWVVVGATSNDMLALGYRQVGKEFPVFLHPKTNEEYALARMERKVLPGYKGFTFDTSPDVSLEADLLRRDLTINAMAESEDGTLIDPYGGRQDLKNKLLRHVSPAFAEDPVRILRVGRFLARYAELGFSVANETMELMRGMVNAGEVNALVAERVWKELERALGEKNPEKFFAVLSECGALPILFQGLNISGHGMNALFSAAQLSAPPVVRFAALLHDLPDAKQNITAICRRYRAPNEYRELAGLTAQYYPAALNARSMTAESLLGLLGALDIFRREKRYHLFLQTCQAIAAARKIDFDLSWLEAAALAAKSVPVQTLINEGFNGEKLAAELRKKRLERLEKWLAT
ncbi:Multifunctional CCA protein [Aquicella siphonis]|uniref:CCA-adding enzyme n=1 Tax=Aquicella siphonis TaxID=254247 RepID=A0A5E4PI73_9COXI|nr:multifunctional CCA tRNA nucleotidyl transferase/2'3'-cyclic phosphodiesterase/2'nucleotidase/phosphatase [Aquicella siphonis]VVC76739.1 Multifunctional CCA protein [Aquicella siphonis]